jgi:RNA polymerase sigma-70 factor (ECF subfamily)
MKVQTMQENRQVTEPYPGEVADYANMTDLELVKSCQRRDQMAFQHLYRRNERNVIGILHRLAPEQRDHSDLAQDVFIRLWTSIGGLRNPNAFKKWMSLITKNVFYDELRRRRPRTVSIDSARYETDDDDVALLQIADQSPPPDELVELRELRGMIDRALVKLPVQFHQVIVLRDMEGLSYQEIGEATDTPVGTVKSRIARAREKMQLHLSPYLSGSEIDDRRMRIPA